MSPFQKVRIIRKWEILDEFFVFRISVMPEYLGAEKNENIAEKGRFTVLGLSGVGSIIMDQLQHRNKWM